MYKLAFDTETTGLPYYNLPLSHPEQPRVVQLGCILFDDRGKEVDILDTLIFPDGWEVDYDSEMVHGWTTDDCEFLGQPCTEILNAFNRMAERADCLVAHHIEFDVTMLKIEAAHYGVKLHLPERRYCTMKRSAKIVGTPYKGGGYKYPGLSEAALSVLGRNVEEEELHEALGDARLAKDLFLALR